MKIRKVSRFSEKVFQAVAGLLPQLSPDAEPITREFFRTVLKSKCNHLFIAELENTEIVGMLSLGSYLTPTGMKVWIEDVVVDESARGKGFGRELMLFAIGYSKALGASDVKLTSRPARIAANELYSGMGFKRYETNFYKYPLKA
jgi:ribosomal protein S18 acetylase RimI-like enzyme